MSNPVPYSAGTDQPAFEVPNDACDCHMHLFDNRFPFVSAHALRHADATIEDYRALQQRLGLRRCVVVQPSSYGFDHRALLHGLARLGPESRGIAVVDTGFDEQALNALNTRGVVGTRFNLVQRGATNESMLEEVADRIRSFGWHIQLHIDAEGFLGLASRLATLPVPVVFDHIARIRTKPELSADIETHLMRMLERGKTWVKLSGTYIASNDHPDYRDLDAFVGKLLRAHPDRVVWGSDWPHVTESEKPDDARLMNLIQRWSPHDVVTRKILVENPAKLYGF